MTTIENHLNKGQIDIFDGNVLTAWLKFPEGTDTKYAKGLGNRIVAHDELVKALNGFKWLGNNLHNIKEDPARFEKFFVSALNDAEKALAKAKE